MKTLVLISEYEQVDALDDFMHKNQIIVPISNELNNLLIKKRIKTKLPKIKNYSDDTYIQWMKSLPKIMKENQIPMLKQLSYDGFSYWWLMEKWLFRGDGHFDSISDILGGVDIVHNMIKKYNPDKIVYADDGRLYSKIIKHVANAERIDLEPVYMSKHKSIRSKLFGSIIKRFWIGSFYLRKILSKSSSSKLGNVDALFIRGIAWDRVYDYRSNTLQIIEPFTSELSSKFKNSLSIGIQVGEHLNIKDVRNLDEKSNIIENYYDKDAKKRHKRIVKTVTEGFERLLQEENFKKSFVYKGYDIWPLVKEQFSRYFNRRLDGHARFYSMISRMIEIEKPKVTISPEEVSETARILFFCSLKNKIPCVAMQHGIFDNNLLCYHNKDEVSFTKALPELCPIPVKTCVYGQYFKDILVKKGKYPSNSVVVTGSQRFDRIINHDYSKESFHRRYMIPLNKKIIAYVTSPTVFNEEMTQSLLEEVKKVKDAFVVIKIHPSEKKEFYEKIISEMDSDAIVLDDSDLYDVLNASDIVVTYLSTAGLEAMLFKKPVAILNLTGAPDIANYAGACAAAGIYKRLDISDTLSNLLSNGRLYKNIMRNSKSFIRRNAFNDDGKATERIEKVIRKLM